MSKKVYVGNMNYTTTETALRDLFTPYGEVSSVNIIVDRYTGKAKGFGFVEMADRAEADKAIAGTNGADFKGRPLRVNESQPKPRDDRGGGGGGGFGGRGGGGGGGGGKRW